MKLGSIRLRTLPVVVKQILKSQTLVSCGCYLCGQRLLHNVSGRFQTVIANMRRLKFLVIEIKNNVTNPFLAHKPFFEKLNTT